MNNINKLNFYWDLLQKPYGSYCCLKMSKSENELIILRILEENPRLTQRELAKKLGVSLGKTNFFYSFLN